MRRMLDNPALQDCQDSNGFGDMMDEDVMNNVSVRLKLSLTVWDFTLPVTPSLPAVFGVSWQYSLLLFYISISVLCNCYGPWCTYGPTWPGRSWRPFQGLLLPLAELEAGALCHRGSRAPACLRWRRDVGSTNDLI